MHRTQILVQEWLNDYIDDFADANEISKGEFMRVSILESMTDLSRLDYDNVEDFYFDARTALSEGLS